MAKFDLDKYETVEARLVRFWAAHPDGRILTAMEFRDERSFIVKAEVYFDREDMTPVATGYAEEIVGASPVNKTSALENCETSAIGRALANCGFQSETSSRPSREEMEKVQRYSEEPRKSAKRENAAPREFTQDDIDKAVGAAGQALATTDLDSLRKIWLAATDFLDAPIMLDGEKTTLKDVVNARAAELQAQP